MQQPFLYLKTLRHVEHTVFCVQDGQKSYHNPQFGRELPFSSGQQVKRSCLELMLALLGENISPVTFNFEITKEGNNESLGNGEPWSACDPCYTDQLVGGWMMLKKDNKKNNEKNLKRRSPLSISALRPLHPLLATNLWGTEEGISFDRSASPEQVKVRVHKSGHQLSEEEVKKFLTDKNVQRPLDRLYMPADKKQRRASGLFVSEIAIDLRTLFSISLNEHEPEINEEVKTRLIDQGWIVSANVFGKSLVAPKVYRDKVIQALSHALINWRITSNQSRTFSLMETLAVAVSDNANQVAGAIRAKLKEETDEDRPRAKPIIDETAGAKLFIGLPCEGYIVGAHGSPDSLMKAEEYIRDSLMKYDYENQLS